MIASPAGKVGSSERVLCLSFTIQQLKSDKIKDMGSGTFRHVIALGGILAQAGIIRITLQGLHRISPGIASTFSRSSMFALNPYLMNLEDIPEIRDNQELLSRLRRDLRLSKPRVNGPRAELSHNERVIDEYARAGFSVFLGDLRAYQSGSLEAGKRERVATFIAYCEKHDKLWLNHYAKYSATQEAGLTFEEMRGQRTTFMDEERELFYKWEQFETARQTRGMADALKALGIKIKVVVPYGIALDSAEALYRDDICDPSAQTGCFPEFNPDGTQKWGVQLWGVCAERPGTAAVEYRAASYKYFAEELGIEWIEYDHACAMSGPTVFPVVFSSVDEAIEKGRWQTDPDNDAYAQRAVKRRPAFSKPGELDYPPELEKATQAALSAFALFTSMVPGIKLALETTGDPVRQAAVEKAARESGLIYLLIMRALAWDETPPGQHSPLDTLSLNQNQPMLLHLLVGKVGDMPIEWGEDFLRNFMRHWGILAPAFKGFIDMKELTYEFVLYLLANICRGSNAGEVEILGTTFMQLQAGRPDRFCRSPRPCTGIMPGTDAGYGNEVGNYSYRAYAIEELDNPAVQETMRALAARAPQEIGEVVEVLPVDDDAAIQANFTAQIARVAGKSVAYQAASGQWTTWDFPAESQPVSQFAVTYTGPDALGEYEDKAWATYKFNSQGLQHDNTYVVHDLVSGLKLSKSGWELEQEGIRIGLTAPTKEAPARNRHHFVIYEL